MSVGDIVRVHTGLSTRVGIIISNPEDCLDGIIVVMIDGNTHHVKKALVEVININNMY